MKRLHFACLLVLAGSLCTFGQRPASRSTVLFQTTGKFVSMEGGFSVDLPEQKDDRTDLTYLFMRGKDDGSFTWRNQQRTISILCFNEIFKPTDAKEILKEYIERGTSSSPTSQATLLSKKDFKLFGNPGIELKWKFPTTTVLTRTVMATNRLCVLRAGWPEPDGGAEQIRVLDSFQFVDNTEFNKKRIDAATPKLLPRSPTIKRSETDAGLDGLKGNVKTVTKLKSAAEFPLAKQITSEDSFDTNGNKLKHVDFDYRGNPWSIEIYGFMEGKLVSNVGTIAHGYDAPAAAAPPGYVKPPDLPYRFSYEFKYDDKRRLIEKQVLWHTGGLERKTIYTYDSNKVDESTTDRTGKEIAKSIKYYDTKGNLIEVDYLSLSQQNGDDIQKFTYEKFDTRGNWTERRVSENTRLRNGNRGDIQQIEYRAITYF